MEELQKIGFDLSQITKAFHLEVQKHSPELDNWLTGQYELSPFQSQLLETLYEEVQEDGGYWNEEELKIQFVGTIFRVADVAVRHKLKVFYERPLSAVVNNYDLAVVSDCLIATPLPFNTPDTPYFFLQEFKKKRGEKKDPEAQMLIAMLIAQELNRSSSVPKNHALYGGYLIGHNWHFATLNDNIYTISRQYDATAREDLMKIVYILRKLKEITIGA
jgi:hypothetical protein